MRKSLLIILLPLAFITGCSVKLTKVSSEDTRLQSLPHRDFNEMSLKITKSKKDPNKTTIQLVNKSKIHLSDSTRIKYQPFYFNIVDLIAVTATLPPNNKKYTALLDTGHPAFVITNSLTILENNLTICPFGKSTAYSSYMGLCEIPSLKLGQAIITNPTCFYFQQQWELRVLGLPIWQQRGVLLGLGILRDFSYIKFDNIRKEAEFSVNQNFEPHNKQQWEAYNFKFKNGKLMVNMPFNGQNFDIAFDSCGRYGMVVKPDFWEKLSSNLDFKKIKDSKFQSGFIGQLPCQKTKIKNLNIGSRVIKQADIIILPKDSPYAGAGSYISMKFFKKTVVVLDFEDKLMYIKK